MPNKRPNKGKPSVPGAVKAIYAVMIVLVLAICGLVFWYTFSQTQSNAPSDSDDHSYNLVNPPDSGSSDTSSDLPSDSEPAESTDTSEPENPDEPGGPDTSDPDEGFLPTDYSDEYFADDLFIGDSIFTGLSLYGYIPAENVAAKIGYTPGRALSESFSFTYSGSAADYAKERQPKRIFILLGSNALTAGASAIAESYSNLVKRLQTDCPDSEICVISITPVNNDKLSSDYSAINNTDIDIVNGQLKLMCSLLGVRYYDFNSLVRDENGNFRDDLSEADGLHFKGPTYKVLLSGLQSETE